MSEPAPLPSEPSPSPAEPAEPPAFSLPLASVWAGSLVLVVGIVGLRWLGEADRALISGLFGRIMILMLVVALGQSLAVRSPSRRPVAAGLALGGVLLQVGLTVWGIVALGGAWFAAVSSSPLLALLVVGGFVQVATAVAAAVGWAMAPPEGSP